MSMDWIRQTKTHTHTHADTHTHSPDSYRPWQGLKDSFPLTNGLLHSTWSVFIIHKTFTRVYVTDPWLQTHKQNVIFITHYMFTLHLHHVYTMLTLCLHQVVTRFTLHLTMFTLCLHQVYTRFTLGLHYIYTMFTLYRHYVDTMLTLPTNGLCIFRVKLSKNTQGVPSQGTHPCPPGISAKNDHGGAMWGESGWNPGVMLGPFSVYQQQDN